MSNVPVLQAVKAAEAFRRLHARSVTGILMVVALGSALGEAGALSGDTFLRVAGQLISMVGGFVAMGALLRLAFADEHPGDLEFAIGPGGFQFGKPELRLIAVNALVSFVLILGMLMFFFALLVILAASAVGKVEPGLPPEEAAQALLAALGPGGAALLVLLMVGMVVAMAYFLVRVSLAGPATVARKTLSVFRTWPLTQGQFWRILAAYIIIWLPGIAAAALLVMAVSVFGGPMAAGAQPRLPLPMALLFSAIPALVTALVVLPLSAGLSAYLYRGLRPAPDVDVFGD